MCVRIFVVIVIKTYILWSWWAVKKFLNPFYFACTLGLLPKLNGKTLQVLKTSLVSSPLKYFKKNICTIFFTGANTHLTFGSLVMLRSQEILRSKNSGNFVGTIRGLQCCEKKSTHRCQLGRIVCVVQGSFLEQVINRLKNNSYHKSKEASLLVYDSSWSEANSAIVSHRFLISMQTE